MMNVVKEAGPASVVGVACLLFLTVTAVVDSTVGVEMSTVQTVAIIAFVVVLTGLVIQEVRKTT